jgi:molybdenum cofactor cytidylyltransferase
MITAIVLAAGKSSRMRDKNKMFLPFRDSTIISNVIAELLIADIDEIIVVSNNIDHKNELAIVSKVQFALNPNPALGMTSSIKIGVEKARAKSHYMICLGDMPTITTNEYNLLIHKFIDNKNKGILQPIFQNKPGNPVLFPNSFRSKILELEYTEGCKPILKDHPSQVIQLEMPTENIHLDIDTEEDYNNLLNRISKA